MFSSKSLCWIIMMLISLVVLVLTHGRRARYILGEDFRSPEILSEAGVYASRATLFLVILLCRYVYYGLATLLEWTRCCHLPEIEGEALRRSYTCPSARTGQPGASDDEGISPRGGSGIRPGRA
ncbi:unnamed protein product [Cuscuta europaea]|uniref:Uncharacterized protein n=1 Tax=Cuscuta europaea TaxID=41803 RepID=A0A9P1E413_CUSEU|nr:unnamed protein product [Cuscuta europaea]